MIQFKEYETLTEAEVSVLMDRVKPVLENRKKLHKIYSKKEFANDIISEVAKGKVVLSFEKFLTDLATGYVSGKPTYTVNVSLDKERNEILSKFLKKKIIDQKQAKAMEEIIKYISNYNDDETENRELIHDIFELRGCYEVVYENINNEIIYAKYSPLQTVATWDYNIPANLTGLLRMWVEKDLNGNTIEMLEVIDSKKKRLFRRCGEAVELISQYEHKWNDVPAIAVEVEFSFFEMAESLIQAYENIVENTKNTFQHNDTEAKLVVKGYSPENKMFEIDENGNYKRNSKRSAEDSAILQSKTFYVNDEGDVKYILKPIDSAGTTDLLKMFSDLIFQMSSVPNTTDLAFNSKDLNASAIDRKFYIMDINTSNTISLLRKAYLRRWELIFNRINLKSSLSGEGEFDFRNIVVDIPKNLPTNEVETADYLLKLKGMISNKTIIETLGFDYLAEMKKLKDENADAKKVTDGEVDENGNPVIRDDKGNIVKKDNDNDDSDDDDNDDDDVNKK